MTRPRIVITMASAMNSECVSVTQVTWDSVAKFSVILPLAVNTANVTNTENVCVIRVTMVATVHKNATDMVAASKTNVFATTAILDYSVNLNATARENVGHRLTKRCNVIVNKIGLDLNVRSDVVQVKGKNALAMVSACLLSVTVTACLDGKEMTAASQIVLRNQTVITEVNAIRTLTHPNVSIVNPDGWARHVMTLAFMACQMLQTPTAFATPRVITDWAVI